jgi:hypothetical protein
MAEIVNTATIRVVADTEQVEAGLRKVEVAAQGTGKNIESLGRNDRSFKNLSDQIQQTTLRIEAGKRGTAEWFATMANARGINPERLKPYLNALDDARRKAEQAAEAQRKLDESTRFLDSLRTRTEALGKSASQLLELRAAQLGVADSARPMIEQLRAAEEAAGGVEGRFSKLKVGLLAVGAAAVAGGTWFASMIKGAVDAADELGDLSKSTGIAVEDLAGLKLAAEQSGGDLNGIADAINKLSVNIGKDAEKFRALGITAKEPIEAFKQLADIFAAIDDPQTRAALGAEALGKSWASAAPLLAEGGNAIGEMVEKGRELSGMTQEMVSQADAFNDKLAELNTTLDGFKVKVANDMLPGLNDAVEAIQKAYTESGKLAATWELLKTAGAFFFTDDFSAAEVRLRNLREELEEVQSSLALATDLPAVGFLGRWIFGESKEALTQRVNEIKQEIKEIQDAANPPEPFKDEFGDKFMGRVAAYRAQGFIGKDKEDPAVKSRAAAIRSEQDAYTGLINSIRERIAATEQEANGLKPLSESSRLQVALDQQLESGKIKLTAAHKANYEAEIRRLSVAEEIIASNKRAAAGSAELEKAFKAVADAAEQKIKAAEDEASRNEGLAQTYGMTKSAIEQMTLARLEEQYAQRASSTLELEEIDRLKRLIDAKRRNAAALAEIEVKDANKKAAEQAVRDWERSAEQIGQSLTDNLMRGGKSAAEYLKDLFRTLILRPILSPIGNLVGAAATGLTSGAAAAAGSSGAGSFTGSALGSAAGSLFGFGGLGGSLAAGAGWLTGATTLGGSLAAAGSLAATGTIAGITSSLGMVVGALGPIALGIGAAVGLFKSAFGRGPKEIQSTTLNGSFGDGGFSGTIDQAWKREGGFFRSDKRGVDVTAVDQAMAKQLGSAYDALKLASADFASVLGINADSLKTRTQSLSIALGKDEEANKKAIADFFIGVGDTIAKELLPSIGQFAKEGEGAAATLERVATSYALIDTALESISKVFGQVGVDSIAARERLIELSGGLEAFAQNTAGFQQNFLTEAERNAPVLKRVTAELAAMGLSAVDTREEFKAVVLGLDLTTEAGAKQYGALMKLQAAFAQVYPEIDKAGQRKALQDEYDQLTMTSAQLLARQRDALDESNRALFDSIQAIKAQAAAAQAVKDQASTLLGNVDSAFSVLQRMVGRERDLIQSRVTNLRSLSDALRNTFDSIRSPEQVAADRESAKAEISAALAIAKAGGPLPDAEKLRKALADISKGAGPEMFATFQDYQRELLGTQGDLKALADITDSQLSVEEKSLAKYDAMLEKYQEQIDVLKGISTTGLTIQQAIEALSAALLQAQANPVVSATAAINDAYKSSLGRAPDAAGLEYWQNQAAGGAPLSDILGAIKGSPEAQVQKLYKDVFGRAADAGGLNFWLDSISKGVSLADVRKALETSEEAKKKRIPGFADGGMFGGGLRVVGERGPELEFTGPSRIISNEVLRRLASPSENNAALAAAVDRLTREVEGLRAETRATATHTEKTARYLGRVVREDAIVTTTES